jgi:hypothetical protein
LSEDTQWKPFPVLPAGALLPVVVGRPVGTNFIGGGAKSGRLDLKSLKLKWLELVWRLWRSFQCCGDLFKGTSESKPH